MPLLRRAELRLPVITVEPGDDPAIDGRKASFAAFEAAAQYPVDCVYFDLEDAEPDRPDLATMARRFVISAIRDIDYGSRVVAVRPHALRSPHFEDDLVALIEEVGDEIDALILPGIETVEEVRELQTIVRNTQRVAGWRNNIALEIEIATPRAVLEAAAIIAIDDVSSLVFDGPALARTLGTALDADTWVWDWSAVRQMLPVVAAAHGKEAVDGSALRAAPLEGDLADLESDQENVRREAEASWRHGFAAKRVHDAAHIDVVQAVFTPPQNAALEALGIAVAYARTPSRPIAGGRDWITACGAIRTVKLAARAGVLDEADITRSGFALPELERLVRSRSHGTTS